MWGREGLKSVASSSAMAYGGTPVTMTSQPASIYSSTPHLFVYQPPAEDCVDVETDPSDSGYADSTRSGSNASGRGSPPEPIYYSALELANSKRHPARQGLSHKFNRLNLRQEDEEEEEEDMGVADMSSCQLTQTELLRVETFFRGHQTQVFVCPSLANLYVRSAKSLVGLNRCSSQPDVCIRTAQKQEHLFSNWQLKYTGVPVVLLDRGGTKSRQQRRIQLILADRDTGFTLWRDTIDNLSNYEAPQSTFHTLRLSTDHRVIVGLSFDTAPAAQQLFSQVEMLTSDPANIRLSAPKSGHKSAGFFKFWSSGQRKGSASSSASPASATCASAGKKSAPRKSDISQPCFFQHVTSVNPNDNRRFFSLQAFVSK